MQHQLAGSHVLDSQYVTSQLMNRDAKEINVANQDIVRIGNLCDVGFLRKLNLSFNKLTSLVGIDQLSQLRELLAYSCQLEDVSHLHSVNKLEKLYLQHNRIQSLGNTLQSMNKLQELRLDKNKLTKAEYISSCVSLKKCNVAHNGLSSCDGIQGLQYLVELNLSNNHLKSITSLKGLPQLRELDISYNQLKSLDGIQYLLKLEILHAEHNAIVHLQIPSIKNDSSVQNREMNNSAQGKKNLASNGKTNSTSATSKNAASSDLPDIQRPIISEIYLSGNRIKSVKGLELYQNTLEILDLSFNQIGTDDIKDLLPSLIQLSQLQEVRFYNNPCCDENNKQSFQFIKQALKDSCCLLQAIDDDAIIKPSDALQRQPSYLSIDSKEFHTWEKGMEGSSVGEGKDFEEEGSIMTGRSQPSSTSKHLSKKINNEELNFDSSDFDSDDELPKKKKTNSASSKISGSGSKKSVRSGSVSVEDGKQRSKLEKFDENEDNEEDENDPDKVNERLGLKVPKLTIKDVLTAEQIQEKETVFLSLLNETKDKLEQTIFKFEQLQKCSNEQERKEFEENEKKKKELLSPVFDPKKRNFKMRNDTHLSEKLMTALDKVLEGKLEVEDDVNNLHVGNHRKDPPLQSLPPLSEELNTKSSVLTDEPVPVVIIPSLVSHSESHSSTLMKGKNTVENLSAKFSPIADKIALSHNKLKTLSPSSPSLTSFTRDAESHNASSSTKFAQKTNVKSTSSLIEDVLPTGLVSGKTIHGSKQSKSEFVITNSFLAKNQGILHQNPFAPLSFEKEVADMKVEEVDFLNIKMSKKGKKSKLSYLQWMNHENKEGGELIEEAEGKEYEGKEEEKIHEEIAEWEKKRVDLIFAEAEDFNSMEEVSDLPVLEEIPKIDIETASRMYLKPHTIGFDSRYGITNDLTLLPESVQLTPKSDITRANESFGLEPSSSR